MDEIYELAKETFERRKQKLANIKKKQEEQIKKDAEEYVKQIIAIFRASNKENEKTIYGVLVGKEGDYIYVEVAYSLEEIKNKKLCGLLDIPEGDVKKIVDKMYTLNIKALYMESIQEHFRCNLQEFFDVLTDYSGDFVVVLKEDLQKKLK